MTSKYNKQDLYDVEGLVAVVTGGVLLSINTENQPRRATTNDIHHRRLRSRSDPRQSPRKQRSESVHHGSQRRETPSSSQNRRMHALQMSKPMTNKTHHQYHKLKPSTHRNTATSSQSKAAQPRTPTSNAPSTTSPQKQATSTS